MPLLLMLGGCGIEQLLFSPPASQAPPASLPPVRSSPARSEVSAGLAPLPTPQQVLTAVPFGRSDPFAALPLPTPPAPGSPAGSSAAAAAGLPAATAASGVAASGPGAVAGARSAGQPAVLPKLVAPEGFRLTGVIRSGGRAEALVSFGSLSGSLRPGDRGGHSTVLLPSGWALAAIQFGGQSPNDPPSVTLRRGIQSVKVRL